MVPGEEELVNDRSCKKYYKYTKALSMRYTEKGADTYCFFYYFFRSIGIWAGEWLGYKLVEPVRIPETCDREAFLRTELLPITGNLEEILDLFHIFADTNAWGAFWLAEELGKHDSSTINNYILAGTETVKKKIHKSHFSSDWHHRYLELYCNCIQTKILRKSMSYEKFWQLSEKCDVCWDLSDPLIEKYRELRREDYDNPAIVWLKAKIYEIFPQWVKDAVFAYEDMISMPFYADPEILYNCAMIYIKEYEWEDPAIQLLEKACKLDKTYYPAAYCLAIMTMNGKAQEEIVCLQNIVNNIQSNKRYRISCKGLKFYVKSNARILFLLEKLECGNTMSSIHQKELEKLQTEAFSKTTFVEIISQMFPEKSKNSLCQEIDRILQERIKNVLKKVGFA